MKASPLCSWLGAYALGLSTDQDRQGHVPRQADVPLWAWQQIREWMKTISGISVRKYNKASNEQRLAST